MFDPADFDFRFRRTERFVAICFFFVLACVIAVAGFGAYAVYSLVTQPETVGEFAGAVVNGYEGAR